MFHKEPRDPFGPESELARPQRAGLGEVPGEWWADPAYAAAGLLEVVAAEHALAEQREGKGVYLWAAYLK
ncbi:MAG TPA: hypothetical protein VKZ50_01410 [bacterium]|nr:hypothetical protein [bacterium]